MKRQTVSSLACLTLLSFNCSSEEDHDQNDMNQDWEYSQRGNSLPNGLYSVEYVVKEDGCSPSLEQLRRDDPSMFPPGLVIFGPNSSASVLYLLLRLDSAFSLTLSRETTGELRDRISESGEYSLGFAAYCKDSTQEFYEANFYRLIRSTAPGVLRVEMVQTWTHRDGITGFPCEGVDNIRYADSPLQFIPGTPCEERYEIVYTLQEECPSECEIDTPRQVFFNAEDEARRYTYPDPDPQDWCVCDEDP